MGDWSFSLRTKASVYCLGVQGRVGEGRVDKRNRLKRPHKKRVFLLAILVFPSHLSSPCCQQTWRVVRELHVPKYNTYCSVIPTKPTQRLHHQLEKNIYSYGSHPGRYNNTLARERIYVSIRKNPKSTTDSGRDTDAFIFI